MRARGNGAPCPPFYKFNDKDVIALLEYLAGLNGVKETVSRSGIRKMRKLRKEMGKFTREDALSLAKEYTSKAKNVTPEGIDQTELDEIDRTHDEALIKARTGEGSALLGLDGAVEIIIWPKTLQDKRKANCSA